MGTRTLMTAAEFERLPDDGNLHELDEGELIIMPPPRWRHGIVQAAVAEALRQAARKSRMGLVVTETGFRITPDTVFGPDVAFVHADRQSEIPEDQYCEFAPDLAVEILSPDDTAARMQRKVAKYLAAGTRTVWVMDPGAMTITVYEKSGSFRTLTAADSIDAPTLIPGFSIPVRTLFE
jgi:Uma2 family endonuclease